jgi:hypothetical protein
VEKSCIAPNPLFPAATARPHRGGLAAQTARPEEGETRRGSQRASTRAPGFAAFHRLSQSVSSSALDRHPDRRHRPRRGAPQGPGPHGSCLRVLPHPAFPCLEAVSRRRFRWPKEEGAPKCGRGLVNPSCKVRVQNFIAQFKVSV